MTQVTIPDTVTAIGEGAFNYCVSLSDISIPDSVTDIGMLAFSQCSGLIGITIPDSVTVVGDGVFYACDHLVTVTVSSTHPYLEMIDGVLFSKPDKRLIWYPSSSTGWYDYTIP